MSATPALVVASPVVSPSSGPISVAWVHVVGAGSVRRDFGHHIATNAAGEAVIAARFAHVDGHLAEKSVRSVKATPGTSLGLSGGRLVKLEAGGRPAWSLPLRDTGLLCAPRLALDDAGEAYIAGPYAPDKAGLYGAREVMLSKLGPGGRVEWTRPLILVQNHEGRPRVPLVRVAADPNGGACVTWIGTRRESPILRALRFSADGSIRWAHAWPITGQAVEPHVGIDASGATVLWGTLQGALHFDPSRLESSHLEDMLGGARYVIRVAADGRVSWAQKFEVGYKTPHVVAVGRDGSVGVATVMDFHEGRPRKRVPKLVLIRLDAAGSAVRGARGHGGPHTSIPSVSITPSGRDAFAVGGYFSGTLRWGATTLQSLTQASEAIFVAGAGPDGESWAYATPVPQLSGGVSVHGAQDGAVLVGIWIHGAMTLGEQRITSPRDQAVLVLAKLSPR